MTTDDSWMDVPLERFALMPDSTDPFEKTYVGQEPMEVLFGGKSFTLNHGDSICISTGKITRAKDNV